VALLVRGRAIRHTELLALRHQPDIEARPPHGKRQSHA
jgi:hypothetical protein